MCLCRGKVCVCAVEKCVFVPWKSVFSTVEKHVFVSRKSTLLCHGYKMCRGRYWPP